MRHWNTITRILNGTLKAPDVYLPVMFESEHGVTRGNDWAQGFMRGAQIRPMFWHELMQSEEYGGSILPMMILSHENDPDPTMRPPSVSSEKREEILLEMIAGLTKIYRHFALLRRVMPEGLQTRSRLQGRAGAKIGRNDLCPCGSGKKYERCCALDGPTMH